jgi:hypothetical protein
MLNLKLQTNAKDIPNLIRVDISGQNYYFTGDFAEIQNRCIQGQFNNFYPYKDVFTVNDIKAFDSSSVTSQDSPREIVDLIGFRSIEEVQFKQEASTPELKHFDYELEQSLIDAETQAIENSEDITEMFITEMFDLENVNPETKAELGEFIGESGVIGETKAETGERIETLEETEDYELPSKKSKKK